MLPKLMRKLDHETFFNLIDWYSSGKLAREQEKSRILYLHDSIYLPHLIFFSFVYRCAPQSLLNRALLFRNLLLVHFVRVPLEITILIIIYVNPPLSNTACRISFRPYKADTLISLIEEAFKDLWIKTSSKLAFDRSANISSLFTPLTSRSAVWSWCLVATALPTTNCTHGDQVFFLFLGFRSQMTNRPLKLSVLFGVELSAEFSQLAIIGPGNSLVSHESSLA